MNKTISALLACLCLISINLQSYFNTTDPNTVVIDQIELKNISDDHYSLAIPASDASSYYKEGTLTKDDIALSFNKPNFPFLQLKDFIDPKTKSLKLAPASTPNLNPTVTITPNTNTNQLTITATIPNLGTYTSILSLTPLISFIMKQSEVEMGPGKPLYKIQNNKLVMPTFGGKKQDVFDLAIQLVIDPLSDQVAYIDGIKLYGKGAAYPNPYEIGVTNRTCLKDPPASTATKDEQDKYKACYYISYNATLTRELQDFLKNNTILLELVK